MAELSKAIARLMAERAQQEKTEAAEPTGPRPPGGGEPSKLERVIAELRARVAPGERVLVEGLARQWLERSGSELLAQREVEELVALISEIFRFLQMPGKQEPRVEILPHPRQPHAFVVRTWMRDRPFIVDTVQESLRAAGARIHSLMHPIFVVERDERGEIRAIHTRAEFGQRESVLRIEMEGVSDPAALAPLLQQRLTAVVWATDDYPAMRSKAEEIADELRSHTLPRPWSADVDEFAAFLDWLGQKNFVFLGYREYEFRGYGHERVAQVRRGSGLGILREEQRSHYFEARPLPENLRRRLNEPPLWLISKTNAESPIHRAGHMDYIGVKRVDGAGVVVGERRFLGLFTARAYAEEPMRVPLLRLKLAHILEAEGAEEGTHSYREIVALFNSMSRVQLLALAPEQLRQTIRTLQAAEESEDVAVVVQPDPLERGVFVTVSFPQNRFSHEIERQVESQLLGHFAGAAILESRLSLDERPHVRMHYYVAPRAGAGRLVSVEELRRGIRSLLQTWEDRFRSALEQAYSRDIAQTLAHRYLSVFGEAYRAATDVQAAVTDVANLETVLASKTAQVDLLPAGSVSSFPNEVVLKLYLPGPPLVLSDFLPYLENLGFQVLAQDAHELFLEELGRVQIHSFPVRDARGLPIVLEEVAPLVRDAVLLLHSGKLENDPLNRLILYARLTWRQVDLLRAYANYALQLGLAPSRETIVRTLVHWPACARALWEYFCAKFDPDRPEAARQRQDAVLAPVQARFESALEGVSTIEEDRLLRSLFAIMQATVRTSYFGPAETPREPATIALKFEGARLPGIGPKPLLETYVHGPLVEGVHLRAARVARGGIRQSDRSDFRKEVLALMLTQDVKNALIVPGGAKGGFVVRRAHTYPVPVDEAAAAYRAYIGALLDVTDNVVRGRVETPARVVAYDAPDPYLVVAADKGTATFSDLANEIALQRGFWLGDAFASGGKFGYDHKKQGITAKGVWECVRRHFYDRGRNLDEQTLDVIGIGDMSGDVFGNGMLWSRRLRLRAAFDHRHVFIDPDPDPLRSYNERERLFRLPQSSWADYNPEMLSRGGGVYPRGAKRVQLSDEARELLGLEPREYSGEELVRAVLCARADLLWNGGIGTYVKASDEPHAAANDPANDGVRVDARDLRVQVVGEGGNLGFTQRGRVEFALHGGSIHTDAIDNSAGVDMSDHEVNLKICLATAMEAGHLTYEERNRLLAEVEADVIERVLHHNRRQAQVLSLDQWRSRTRLHEFRDLMSQLESDGLLDRRAEHLPDRDQLRARRPQFLGLTQPELAVMLAHTKRWLQREILASSLPDDGFFETYLRGYFPAPICQRFGLAVRSHPLRREIIAVEVANEVIDRLGMTFVPRLCRDTGAKPVAAVRAIAVVGAVLEWDRMWAEIGQLQPALSSEGEREILLCAERGLERAVAWYLETQPANVPAADMYEALRRATTPLWEALPDVFHAEARAEWDRTMERLASLGVPRDMATRLGRTLHAAELFDIAELAAGGERNPVIVARSYYGLAELFSLDWLRRSVEGIAAENRWEQRARNELLHDIAAAHRKLTERVLACGQHGKTLEQCLLSEAKWQQGELEDLQVLLRDARAGRELTLAQALVVARELLRFAERPQQE
ncbi:MAG: NAD-glutamate dehydrogenase [Candidatus Binatia bacterium]|nr:MAG: NAD-glutamate dehydrogenase [Candidatus Binatia bacterium]